MFKCLLCTEEGVVRGSQLRDHIGGEHFGHASHQCQTCGTGFVSGKKALKHAGMTGHVVTLNGVRADAGKEKLIGMNYTFCLQERVVDEPEEEILETTGQREKMIEVQSYDAKPLSLPPGAYTSVKSNFTGLPDVTGERKSKRATTVSRSAVSKRGIVGSRLSKSKKRATVVQSRRARKAGVAKSKKDRLRCQLCNEEVTEEGNNLADRCQKHVRTVHVRGVLRCPVQGCDYHVEGFYQTTNGAFSNHLRYNHSGLSSLKDEERKRHEEQREEIRAQAKRAISQCFPTRG